MQDDGPSEPIDLGGGHYHIHLREQLGGIHSAWFADLTIHTPEGV